MGRSQFPTLTKMNHFDNCRKRACTILIYVYLSIIKILDVKDPPPGRCANVMVYIADVSGFGIIVYDAYANRSWRVQNKLLYPNPNYGTHTIANESFDLMDGIFGLAITPNTGEKLL